MCVARYSVDIDYVITLLTLFTFTFCHSFQVVSQSEEIQIKTQEFCSVHSKQGMLINH